MGVDERCPGGRLSHVRQALRGECLLLELVDIAVVAVQVAWPIRNARARRRLVPPLGRGAASAALRGEGPDDVVAAPLRYVLFLGHEDVMPAAHWACRPSGKYRHHDS